MDTWPIGTRDTTEFPKLSPIKVQYRDHLEKILQLSGRNWNDSGEFGTPSRFRSYRKMYERLGIICKNGDKLVSTWLGEKVEKLEQGLLVAQQAYLDQMRNEIIAILSRYQFKNPSERDSVSFPDDFDIQPCVCFWKMMLALGNKINYQEVNRVVLRIMHMADIDAAIEKIKTARAVLTANPSASLDTILGIPVVSDQPTARIAGLFSQIGWGDLLITGVQDDGFRYLNNDAIPALQKVVENPPHFYEANSEKDCINYFIGKPRPETLESAVSTLNVDRLEVALRVFAEKRYETEWQDKTRKDGYQNIYDMAGMTPEQIAAGSLDDFYNDFLLKIWAFKNGGSRRYGQLDEAGRKAYRQFVVDLKTQLKSFDAYFPPDPKCPDGMGVGVLTELMMRFWPKSCCSYNKLLIHDALVTLGMAEGDFVWPKTPSVYQDFMGKCATILLKMEQMKLPRRSDPGNDEPPDYITVNEFLWFVREYKDLIQEEVMSKALKKDKPQKHNSEKGLVFSPESKDDELLLRLLASLRAKPFAILAGHSGTGKSRYVKKLAYMTCNAEELRNDNQLPGNYLLLQVKPNWHDSTDLLGFRNAMAEGAYQKTELIKFLFKAYHFSKTPFFLCLDEMNLAPVEQYFAEFLSAMESKEPVPLNDISEKDDNLLELGCEWEDSLEYLKKNGFSIPKNLFIVGTVNMDETTNQFSRKVLDRAFTIEMTDVDFANYGKVAEPSYDDTIKEELIAQLLNGEKAVKELDEDDTKEDSSLVKVQKALASTPFAIAYRFANEYALLKRAIECFDADGKMNLDALDQAVLMKILPRIAGEKDYIEKVYGKNDNEGLRKALEGKSVSLKKIAEIMKRANDMNAQYITFWP